MAVMAINCCKWLDMTEMVGKGWLWLEMTENIWNGWNGWIWLEMAENGSKRLEWLDIAGNSYWSWPLVLNMT